ncbi:MAG: hypothetical protein ACI4TU_05950 [Candidatus Cryptobacteroides sp.]
MTDAEAARVRTRSPYSEQNEDILGDIFAPRISSAMEYRPSGINSSTVTSPRPIDRPAAKQQMDTM